MWWFLILCLIVSIASQEECLEACSLPVSTCTYVDYPVYPVGLNVSKNEELAGTLRSTAMSLIGNDEVCRDALFGYSCGVLYPKCNNQTNQKIKPCLSQCRYVRETACSIYMRFLDQLPPEYQEMIDCSRTDGDGTPFFFDDTGIAEASTQGLCYTLYNLTSIERCGSVIPPNTTNDQPGGCQMYDAASSPRSSAVCAPFISKEIYVDVDLPGVQSFIDSEERFVNLTNLLMQTYRLLPVGCYKKAMALACQTAYPQCDRVTDPSTLVTYEVPKYPCYETCESALDECSYILGMIGPEYQNIINCGTAKDDGSMQWPHGPTYTFRPVPGRDIAVTTECSQSVFPQDAVEVFVLPDFDRCPVIMARKPNPKDKDFQCWVPCPDPTYSDKEWQDLVTVSLVFASISFICMFFMLTTTLLDAQRRSFRLHMPIYFSGMMMAVAFFLSGTDPRNEVWCDDPVTYATARTNTRCAVQGFLFHFFGLSAILWWVVIGYHMFSCVFLNHTPELKKKEKFYHLFAWGIPLILAIITLSINAYSYAPPAPWCYIHDPHFINAYDANYKDPAGISLDYYVFYIPIGISLILTLTFLGLVFYKVFKVLRSAKSLRKAGNDARVQFRIVFFLVVLLVLFFLIFEWRISLQVSDPDEIKEVDLRWAICKIKIDMGFPDSGECPGNSFPKRVNYNYTAFETCLAASFGFWIFVTFGTDISLFVFWKKFLKNRTWPQLKQFVLYGDKETGSSIHRSSSTIPMHEKNSKNENQSKISASASANQESI